MFDCEDAQRLKDLGVAIEEETPWGRLFDIDVIGTEGEKLSRPAPRRCIVCGGPAADCARSRAHGLDQIKKATDELIAQYLGDSLGTAAASALTGYITDPSKAGSDPAVPAADISIYDVPEKFRINDSGVIAPLDEEAAKDAEVVKGPNIKPFPETYPLEDSLDAEVILKTGDNITTDHIMPAGSKILPYRSNIPHLSQYCFEVVDPEFPERAKAAGKGIIVGGQNYGQGSSREHAALVPLYLGIRAVIAKSFARIHAANLVNAGILPLIFENEADYDRIAQGDRLELSGIHEGLKAGKITAKVISGGAVKAEIPLCMELAGRQKEMLLAGGLLKYTAGK